LFTNLNAIYIRYLLNSFDLYLFSVTSQNQYPKLAEKVGFSVEPE
jgi:hypothetical protein